MFTGRMTLKSLACLIAFSAIVSLAGRLLWRSYTFAQRASEYYKLVNCYHSGDTYRSKNRISQAAHNEIMYKAYWNAAWTPWVQEPVDSRRR